MQAGGSVSYSDGESWRGCVSWRGGISRGRCKQEGKCNWREV